MNGGRIEHVVSSIWLCSDIHESGITNEEIGHRVRERDKVRGAMRAILRNNKISVEAVKKEYEAVVELTVLF